MGLKHGSGSRGNWLCWKCHVTAAGMQAAVCPPAGDAGEGPFSRPVKLASDVLDSPNCTPREGVAQLDEVLDAFRLPYDHDLRKFVLYDTLHCFYSDGLLDKIVGLTFHLTSLTEAGIRHNWLRTWQVEQAAQRLREAAKLSLASAFRRNIMDRRTVAAHAVFVLEGIVYGQGRCPCLAPAGPGADAKFAPTHFHSQIAHLAHLRNIVLQYSFEEAAERDLCDLPFLRTLTANNVQTAARLYGPRLVGTYKVHSLLHLYESHASPQAIRDFTGRDRGRNGAFSLALAHRMPTMVHVATTKGEALHKPVKEYAAAVFKAGPGNAKEAENFERTLELRIAEKAPAGAQAQEAQWLPTGIPRGGGRALSAPPSMSAHPPGSEGLPQSVRPDGSE